MQLKRIIAALLLLGLGSIALFELDPSLKYELRDEKYRWMGQKIFDPKTRIDVLYIGSSRIWTGVDTIALNEQFPDQHAYNFGKNWHGQQVNYVMLEDLLARKQVKKIVYEVYGVEPGDVHPYTKFFAHPWDLSGQDFYDLRLGDVITLQNQFKFSVDVQLQILLGLPVKGYYLLARRIFLGSHLDADFSNADPSFGYLIAGVSDADQERFWSEIRDQPQRYEVHEDEAGRIRDRYLKKVSALVRAHGAELYFLFMPAHNEPAPSKKYRALLESMGTFVDLREHDLMAWELWRDANHLNVAGARLFTRRLAESPIYLGAGR